MQYSKKLSRKKQNQKERAKQREANLMETVLRLSESVRFLHSFIHILVAILKEKGIYNEADWKEAVEKATKSGDQQPEVRPEGIGESPDNLGDGDGESDLLDFTEPGDAVPDRNDDASA